MLYLVTGENVFMRDVEVAHIVADRDVRRIDGVELDKGDLADIFAGQSLFSAGTVNVIRDMSMNKATWEAFEAWVEAAATGEDSILIETKPDKRTKTYKALQKQARVVECSLWTERQMPQAQKWLRTYATEHNAQLSPEQNQDMVTRAMRPSSDGRSTIIDQQLLASAVQQLTNAKDITTEVIDTVLAPSRHENVFELLAAALGGDTTTLQRMIHHLKQDEDGHKVFGLLGSQATNLATLVLAGGRDPRTVASDLGVHPFALSQLSKYANKLSRRDAAVIIDELARADIQLKTSGHDPWLLIEHALVGVATKISR